MAGIVGTDIMVVGVVGALRMVTGVVGAHARRHVVAVQDGDPEYLVATRNMTQTNVTNFATMEELIMDQDAIVIPGGMATVANV